MAWSYRDALRSCIDSLAESRDGSGWGITAGAAASIVNTAEALFVLDAGRRAGVQIPLVVEADARAWLARAVPEHCRLRAKGGRGEKTRFVTFGLFGLALPSEEPLSKDLRDGMDWCADWLLEHRLPSGWGEEAQIEDVSIFETAMALRSATLLAGRSELEGTRTAELALAIVSHGIDGLLTHRKDDGSWPTQFSDDPSPSKTSLSLIALDAVRGSDDWDGVSGTEVGSLAGDVIRRIPRSIFTDGAQWLIDNSSRWVHLVESDPDVPGTVWNHLAYALGVQALAQVGSDATHTRVLSAWRLILDQWDAEYASWNEPSTPPAPTIRATFASVSALDALLVSHGTEGMSQMQRMVNRSRADSSPFDEIDLQKSDTKQFCLYFPRVLDGARAELPEFSPVLAKLVQFLARGWGDPRQSSPDEIAAHLRIEMSSVGTYVRRLNDAVMTQLRRQFSGMEYLSEFASRYKLVVSERRHGYRLNVNRVTPMF